MNRRTFLKGLLGGVATVAVAQATGDWSPLEQWIPGRRKYFDLHVPAPKFGTIGLTFHPDAYVLVMEDISREEFRRRYLDPAIEHLSVEMDRSAAAIVQLHDRDTGISLRFLREYEYQTRVVLPNTAYNWIR